MSISRRLGILLLSISVLALCTLACIDPDIGPDPLPTAPPTPVPATPVNVQVAVDVRFYDKVPTAFFHLLGKTSKQQHFSTFTLSNQGTEAVTVKVVSEIEGLTEEAIDTVSLSPGQTTAVDQTPIMKADARSQLNEGRVASFHYRVSFVHGGQEGLVEEQSHTVDMMSKRDLLVAIVDEDGELVADFREYAAAWVTPSSPAVEELLREAVTYMPDEAIYGYQGGSEGVLPQLGAVYRAINDLHQIRYVHTPVSLARTDQTIVQRVRLPAETIAQQAGNCIETSALYASAIEAMDMNPLLVLVPGHAFIACETGNDTNQYIFVETTVLGEGMTFEDALAAGQENWGQYQSQMMLIDVRHWRTQGILPIPED